MRYSHDDDHEQVTFTEAEWLVMLSDPSFGYVCRNGHRLSDGDRDYGACFTCESLAEQDYEEMMDAVEREQEARMAAADSEAEWRADQATARYEAVNEAAWERWADSEPF